MISFNELKELFISNLSVAIEKSQNIICSVTNFDSFNDFCSFHLQHPHMSTCQKEWAHEQMAIHCFNCATDINSCICPECYLKGNHQGHDIEVRPDVIGNCDCGDLSLWKRSGFCSDHPGIEEDEHPELYLDEKLRTVLTDVVFKACFSSLKDLRKNEDDKIDTIIQFLSTFLEFGDGFRRLISISLTENSDFEYILNNIFDSSIEFNESFQKFCGGLTNDSIFRVNFSQICYKLLIEKVIPADLDYLIYGGEKSNYEIWDSFWFHSFTQKPVVDSIVLFNFDWVSYLIDFATKMKKFLSLVGYFDAEFPDYFPTLCELAKFGSEIQPNEQTQSLFDNLFTKVLNCGTEEGQNDTIIVTSSLDPYEKGYFHFPNEVGLLFNELLSCFRFKPNLKFDKLIEELDKTIDISKIFCLNKNSVGQNSYNENDLFISRFLQKVESDDLNILHYKSFHNGASFFISFPLYDSLATLFKNDNLTRVKIGKLLSLEKYQSLRIQLGIVTLKKILSFICYYQSLVKGSNFEMKSIMNKLNSKYYMCSNLPLYIPLFQMLIGLQCKEEDEFSLKEFFAFEIEREIGLFDDFTDDSFYSYEDINEKQTQMIFSVLYLSLLIVIERTLFNYNGYKFIEEQIILGLKEGNKNLDDLEKIYDQEADLDRNYMQDFNSIISKVAKNRNLKDNGKDSIFYLKDNVEWKTITALNLLNNQKVLLNNEILKNTKKLIEIPKFESEKTYFFKQDENYKIDTNGLNMKLNEFLLTPSILAIVYYTLNSNNNSNELNDHLAMNILILASKFSNEIESQTSSSFNESTIIEYDSSLADLISKFKRIIFNFKIDQNGNAKIQNTLNKKTFNSFLKIKIGSYNQEPKSFIDILLERGEIGKDILHQMSVDLFENQQIKPSKKINKKSILIFLTICLILITAAIGIGDIKLLLFLVLIFACYMLIDFNKNEKSDVNEIKKDRARKLKKDIMNQFKNSINNFNLNEIDSFEENQTENKIIDDSICSICSTSKNNEILSYPLYIYRTKFPFIFDKPPLIKPNSSSDVDVCDENQDFIENVDFHDEDEGSENEEDDDDDEIPDLKDMINDFYNTIDITASPDEYEQLYNEAFDEYSQITQRIHHKNRIQNERKRIHQNEEKRITVGNNFVIQFGICQHPIHPSCVNKTAFKCPIDRSYKNGFLPILDSLPKESIYEMKNEIQESINLFTSNFVSLFNKNKNAASIAADNDVYLFIELIKSISGLIVTYEVRLRNLPGCLDSDKTKFLSRNLFLTTWYAYRLHGKPELRLNSKSEINSKLTIFQRFIKTLIENDEIEKCMNKIEKFKEIVSSFMNSNFDSSSEADLNRKDKEMFLFLRRVCLSDYFLVNNNVNDDNNLTNFIDWDEILSISNLTSRYGIQFSNLKENEFEFKSFFFTKLPHEFLGFLSNPYTFPIFETTKIYLFNILDYNHLISNYDDFDDDDDDVRNYQKNLSFYDSYDDFARKIPFNFSFKVFPSIFLCVGKFASELIIVDGRKVADLKPFYLDSYNSSDIGFQRCRPLFLNEERYMKIIDEILSGDFSNHLISFDEFFIVN